MSRAENTNSGGERTFKAPMEAEGVNFKQYLLMVERRKWLVIPIFLIVAFATAFVSYRLPNFYTSETVILVDPQQVPDRYVIPTVEGDVRNRLGTLTQQVLSESRLQIVIDKFGLYPNERKTRPREDVIAAMRKDIVIDLNGDARGVGTFKITYTGRDPILVAKVTSELATLFINENLKARELTATGTTDFLQSQLDETRQVLERQEAQLRDFKLHHLGEMPDQQQSNLQILSQLQSQLQSVNDSVSRSEQQRNYLQAMLTEQTGTPTATNSTSFGSATATRKSDLPPTPSEQRLAELLTKYGEKHPDVQRLRLIVEDEKKAQLQQQKEDDALLAQQLKDKGREDLTVAQKVKVTASSPLKSQLASLDQEIGNAKRDQDRLQKSIATYQAKLEAGPVREQEITDLVRDYDISKNHYSQLLDKKLAAEMATQLEIKQKGEKFTILDPAEVAQRPSRPNRPVIITAGCLGGLALGIAVVLASEFLGMSVVLPAQAISAAGVPVLGEIPLIIIPNKKQRRRTSMALSAGGGVAALLALAAAIFFHIHAAGL